MHKIVSHPQSNSNDDKPTICKTCGGTMIYKGMGEYRCASCRAVEYDDYGKIRNYLDSHPGAMLADIERDSGVSHEKIKELVKDQRFSMINSDGIVNQCVKCGRLIKAGKICDQCKENEKILEDIRLKNKKVKAYASNLHTEEAKMRFANQDNEKKSAYSNLRKSKDEDTEKDTKKKGIRGLFKKK